MQPGARYSLMAAGVLVLVIVGEFVVHMARSEPRDTRAIAERELRLNTLQPGERVIRSVSVFKRPAIEYFRATRGLITLTDKRLVYLGLEPRDLLAAPDLPPTFEERDFPIDTSVHVSSGRTFFGLAHAIVISTPNETIKLGVPAAARPGADVLVVSMNARRSTAIARSVEQSQLLVAAEAQWREVERSRRLAKYYVVRRGDALGGIATIWNTTPDKLRAWNSLSTNNIRAGQRLMVKPAV
jgi:LysM domain-containing protein